MNNMINMITGEVLPDPHRLDDVEAPEALAEHNKEMRQALLFETDWTQLSDVNQKIRYAYVGYRQALRDLPDHPNWPQLTIEDWPKKPNV
jgi:hypothetical protein